MAGAVAEQVLSDRDVSAVNRVAALANTFGSEPRFRAFYDQALPRVYGYLYNRCGSDRSTAEELTQETFAAAIREYRAFDGRSDAMTWLIAIARHKLADLFRRRDAEERRHLRLLVRELPAQPDLDPLRSVDERAAIMRALRALPAIQRAVLILHYGDGLPVHEVAERLGKTEKSVESHMTRARDAFRVAYGEYQQ